MSSITAYLPQAEGLLPKWIMLISVISIANSVQAYVSIAATRRVYAGARVSSGGGARSGKSSDPALTSPVTPLSARTFGTWTVITALVRFYVAYRLDDPAWYQLGLWTFVVAWGHFVSEWLVFGTVRLNEGSLGPLIVPNATIIWMVLQWRYYVK